MHKPVALARCDEYRTPAVEVAVRKAVDLIGGMARFVQPGQRVLVKPNLLLPSEPDRAIVTHPLVLRAVVRLVQEAGGQVLIADNPVVIPVTQRGWETAYHRAGWDAVAAETGARLNTHIEPLQVSHPDAKLVKLMDTTAFLMDADVVISVPKLKTHGFMRYTGAVKNLFGTVPGATKFGYHIKLQTAEQFAEMLLDLVSFVRPALTIMDGIVGMENDGPSAGEPVPIGAVLASEDPVALDVAAIDMVGKSPISVPTVAAAVRRGLTSGEVGDLTLVGDELNDLRVSGFRMPDGGRTGMGWAPGFLRQMGTRQLVANPVVVRERCVGCGLCVDNCPAQTIVRVEGKAQISLRDCIRCYCCHELCPEHAIELRKPLLARALATLSR